MTFNAIKDKELKEEEEPEEEDGLRMIVWRFKKLYRKDEGFPKFHKDGSSSKRKSNNQIICYKYKKPGYIISEYPLLKNKDTKKKHCFKAYVCAI